MRKSIIGQFPWFPIKDICTLHDNGLSWGIGTMIMLKRRRQSNKLRKSEIIKKKLRERNKGRKKERKNE